MGIGKWFSRKGNIGGTARAVAKGWITLKKQNPEMAPGEIADAYVKIRYGASGGKDLSQFVLYSKVNVTPIELSWGILIAENYGKGDVLEKNVLVWGEIMREEIQRLGLDPDDNWKKS